ncbi:hypothetical protein [Fodinibius sp. Rm-B-1B1-1]|uniref:hypothetical protein n=1 Tax=Fodinibius alkaliphilus TaxID=3140241 RepID=UPI00315A075C
MRPALYPQCSFKLAAIRWLFLLSSTLLISFLNTSQSGAQSLSSNLSIEEGAQLWIEGSASMVNFKCKAQQLSGVGEIGNTEHPETTVQGQGTVSIAIILPVDALDCGKRAMNKDMYEALKAEQHSTIGYQLLEATLTEQEGIPSDSLSRWMNIRTRGIMKIAGEQDTTTFNVQGKILNDQRFRVKGSKPIHMDTYNIDPPRAMFGLIKADKNLTVHFDVIVRLNKE